MSLLMRTEPEVVVGPEPLAPRVVRVEAVDGERIRVSFETGDVCLFDVSPLLDRGVFRALRDTEAFCAVSVVAGGGGVEWASGPDLSAGRLHSGGEPVRWGAHP